MSAIRAWILLISLPALVLLAFFWLAPPRHNPFAPVDLTETPGIGTWHKLTRTKRNREMCFAALDDAGVLYTPLEDQKLDGGCGLTNALTLDQTLTPYSATLRMTCGQAAALYSWERHIARPMAIEILGSPIARIETYGSFSCRNIAGTRRISQHGLGNAIDVSGFRLEDGRLISVKTHWDAGGAEQKFLRRLHKGACDLFSVTLGPEYNAAHADHFHLDMGGGKVCR